MDVTPLAEQPQAELGGPGVCANRPGCGKIRKKLQKGLSENVSVHNG
ncbi:hypothetical protein HMPREF1548_03952 [Clostridium sp. KLE 1755]|nr:hypothetical protein HMPREF1548_03952 [Clostridium sp. KLE 1755]